ncbi:MAG TPA: fumarylacetoacetate hydrolase family protein [Armatimonadota bacterium]|jgi:2-keto-4-pentenoate hydratase/2-oxohepta-3-ene-1,7-dioic acid hydratase in catechol pathway
MKLVMYGDPYEERPGVVIDDMFILDLERAELASPHSIEEILEFDLLEQIQELITEAPLPEQALIPLGSVRLGPPLSGMGKIVACGLNYRAHAAEMGNTLPANPLLFAKAPSAIAGPTDDLMLPPSAWSHEVDYEVELGVVIGHTCHEVSVEDALAYVAGYTLVNDVTARDVQRAESQWFRAKSYNGFCPVGPYLVTADEIPDPQTLSLSTRVNDALRQHSSTSDMIFSVAELISFTSHAMTLQPGDLLATGTPSGIGAGLKPPVFLKSGDVLDLQIDGLGQQRMTVIAYDPLR